MQPPILIRYLLHGLVSGRTYDRLARYQLGELQKQIPSLHILVSINACALAYIYAGLAPAWLTFAPLALILAMATVRCIHWRRLRPEAVSKAQALRSLRTTIALTVVYAVALVSWSTALGSYGSSLEQSHAAIVVAITVVGCIFGLTHLPAASFLASAVVMGAFLTHCLFARNAVFLAIALNTVFVIVVMARILLSNFRTFIELMESQDRATRLAEENARLAHTDSLTGLPNRRYFFQRLDALIESSRRTGAPFGLAIFDLDRFKPVNDTYGHTTGDRVLTVSGQRFAAFADANVTVTRLGGDEFGVLFEAPGSPEEAVALADRICQALQEPIRLGEIQVVVGCSGGLALFPDAGRRAEALFDRADHALYHSKQRRRGVTTLFSQEHEDAIRAERAVESALRGADLAAEMEVHYQPILDTLTDEIVMVEGLARWTSPTLGRVPPDRFIAVAERCGMIHTLTLLLFRKALADAARLPPQIELSFNLSSHDLTSSGTVIALIVAVRQSEIDPRRITLELTETALMRDFDRARDAIRALRALGIRIALDDFGTGYSSLGYVHRLPLDRIKIDRSFMADIGTDLGRSVVSTILDLCKNLGVEGVAEGVETADQLVTMRRSGCRYVQGYLIGAPMPLNALLDSLDLRAQAAAGRLSA
ncbi:putative bifunctional diguanylate cyclase/phosphodiesterase [Methylobacterium symbioticum]|uniref:Putative signaling protein n=1 Tax=Methylobacterium symbioticum TaxID=2584084 RepID=A0A509E7F8_9HYPH|nr:putative signaling protein [Methylobacterium symbioticum]